MVVAVAAGGIGGLPRAPALLADLQTDALHVPKRMTIKLLVCLLGGFLGRSHAENARLLGRTGSHAKHASTSGNNKLACS